jgi:hypothetical protein
MTATLEQSVKVTVTIGTDHTYDNPHVKQQQVTSTNKTDYNPPYFSKLLSSRLWTIKPRST